MILLWDLRNANAPEKILTGHNQGILSLSWCKRDPDLLLSSGKDNRTLLWNPQSGDLLGEFPIATNWTFETRWYDRNPGMFASASFDGKISVQSLQNTKKPDADAAAPKPEGNDFWNSASYADTQKPTFILKQAPKWLQRPVGASFGFGGKLVTFKLDENRKSVIGINKVVIEPSMASETEKFEAAIKNQSLMSMAETRAEQAVSEQDQHDWKILLLMYEQNPKQRLVELLGYTSSDLEDLFKKFGGFSVNGTNTNGTTEVAEEKSEEPKKEPSDSIFGELNDNADPFFSSIGNAVTPVSQQDSAGFTPTGSFTIIDGQTSETDKLITQAIVLGNFSSAIDICLADDRMSDAFMLALSGDDACRSKVQNAYFQKNSKGPSYVRVLSSIASKSLSDLVDNAEIGGWKEIVVALCTFAADGEFKSLIAKLGDRLSDARKGANAVKSLDLRKSASICYFAGADLQKLVKIWIEELADAEKEALKNASASDSPFAVHIKSLQDFIEKVTVFRNAVKYTDSGSKTDANTWALSELYEAYREYANVVASQGFLELAHKYLVLLPSQYSLADLEQDRLLKATSKAAPSPAAATLGGSGGYQPYGAKTSASSYAPYTPAAPTGGAAAVPAPATSAYAPVTSGYQPLTGAYQPAATQATPANVPPPPISGSLPGAAYRSSLNIPAPPVPVTSPPDLHHEHAPIPPPPVSSYQSGTKSVSGWNDALPLKPGSSSSRKQTPAPTAPITAPFPGMSSVTPSPYAPPPSTGASSAPSYGRPANIAPPPTNAKPPQSVVPSPVQSPPPVGRVVSSYAPSVEFVSVGQMAPVMGSAPPPPPPTHNLQSAVPPLPAGRYGAQPTVSAPPVVPSSAVNPYAPPPQPAQATAPPPQSPYAPVTPQHATGPGQAVPSQPASLNLAQYAPPPLQDGFPRAPSIARSESPAMSVVAESMHPHHLSAPPPKYRELFCCEYFLKLY